MKHLSNWQSRDLQGKSEHGLRDTRKELTEGVPSVSVPVRKVRLTIGRSAITAVRTRPTTREEKNATYLPAAKMLLLLPLLTSTAVTGPGNEFELPITDHVWLAIVYIATLVKVPSAKAIEPEATTRSRVFCEIECKD